VVSRRDLETKRMLLAVGEARTAVAKANLVEAERHRSQCVDAMRAKETQTEEAFEVWSASIASRTLGPTFVLAAAGRLIAAESGLVGARKQVEAAEREAEDHAAEYRAAEARRSNEAKRHHHDQRRWQERQADKRQDEVQEILVNRRARA